MTHLPPITQSSQSSLPMESLVSALQQRSSWPLMRNALKHEKFPVGLGWKELLGHATESTTEGTRLRIFLQKYFAESIVVGDRFVQLYEFSETLAASVVKKMQSATVPNSMFSSTYPLPIDQKILSTAPDEPTLCEIRFLEKGDASLIFCAARSFDDRLTYDYSDLAAHVQQAYGEIDKLITVRKVFYQAYDVVTIRSSLGRIEICVDQPEKTGANSLETLPIQILTACALHLSEFVGLGGKPPENLFPAIASMYSSKTEGQVKSLSFRTMTGSIKKERMTSSAVDLRDEKFHHAGMNALGQKISPYEIAIAWEFKLPAGEATLKLSALIREIASATPTLHGCYVSSSTSSSFFQALNRLSVHL